MLLHLELARLIFQLNTLHLKLVPIFDKRYGHFFVFLVSLCYLTQSLSIILCHKKRKNCSLLDLFKQCGSLQRGEARDIGGRKVCALCSVQCALGTGCKSCALQLLQTCICLNIEMYLLKIPNVFVLMLVI